MPDAAYTRQLIGAVVLNAAAAVKARISGASTITLGEGDTRQTFGLTQGGYCARFIRQCYETGGNWPIGSWQYASATANRMLAKLKAAGHAIGSWQADKLLPGDILGISGGIYGHVMLYAGNIQGTPTVAENTSAVRGNPSPPGTKYTPLATVAGRINCAFRLLRQEDWTDEGAQQWNIQVHPDASGDIVASGWATTWTDRVTRTGVSATVDWPACSLPRGLCEETKGSPFGGVPDWTIVRVHLPSTNKSVYAPVIDEGPAWAAQAGTGKPGSAMIDLNPAAWKALGGQPNRNEQVTIRILAGSATLAKALRE